ncbi:MAG: ABC transporter permease [Candidatus Aminicenantes bacterium]|nr:ABC transporter permease [Candidatus Aminicenantes bacterium]
MRFLFLFRKEWREIFRQKEMVALLFIAPLIQTIILGYVVRTDVTNLPVGIINLSQSIESQRLINRLASSPLFKIKFIASKPVDAEEIFRQGKSKALIIFREREKRASEEFSFSLPEVQVLLDGSDANSAMIAAGYFYGLFGHYITTLLHREDKDVPFQPKTIIRFNPSLNSLHTMGPAIVALLLTIITILLTGIGLVREKEQQTLDTLLVSKLTPIEIFLGKTLPMAAVGLIEMTLGIMVVITIFDVTPRGNLAYLYLAAVAFLFSILSIGFLISLISQSQQQALFFCWFTMLLFLMLSGLLTPLENIPPALRWLTVINPLRYLIAIIREIFLKGNGLAYFWQDILIMAGLGLVAFLFSLRVFRRFVIK